MDSFKGSLTSEQAGNAVKAGIIRANAGADVSVYPFADGGEGTLDAFLKADSKSRRVTISVSGPLGNMTGASYGILSDDTVVIEIAQAAGLCLLPVEERNPLYTTTRGVGQLMVHALNAGYSKFIIALGGSATNDCGAGMLKELGLKIYDAEGLPVEDGALGLSKAASIDDRNLIPSLKDCDVVIACDVENPLCGTLGASRVFAPQKGAGPKDVENMDKWIKHFSDIIRKQYPGADPEAKGAGAAGGLGFAFMTFLNGKMQPGADVLLERCGIEEKIASSDLVITGEGKIDGQTAMGKAPARIAGLAKKHGKTVIAIAGCVGEGYEKCHDAGIDALFPVMDRAMDMEEAMRPDVAVSNIERTSFEITRLLKETSYGKDL